jgi:hypothetical protein
MFFPVGSKQNEILVKNKEYMLIILVIKAVGALIIFCDAHTDNEMKEYKFHYSEACNFLIMPCGTLQGFVQAFGM